MAKLPGGTRRKENGSFEKRFSIGGKRYSVTATSIQGLEEKESEVREQIKQGMYVKNRDLTLNKYFEEWLKERRKSTKSNTLQKYNLYYRKYISEKLGGRKIKEIESREVKQFQSDLLNAHPDFSAGYVNLIMKTLKIILNDAVRDEVIARSPAANVKAVKDNVVKAIDSIHRALTKEEQIQFLKEMESDFYYEFIALLLLTGMRQGEVAALTWRDIDHKNKVIHITKTVTRTEQGSKAIGTPKTDASFRVFPLNDDILEVLESQKQKMRVLNGDTIIKIDGNIFTTNYGCLIESQQINRAIRKCIERLAKREVFIDHFTAHGLRDTFATRFIEAGGNPQTLKKLLGHNSLAMTMDLYSHVMPDTKAEEVGRLNLLHMAL